MHDTGREMTVAADKAAAGPSASSSFVKINRSAPKLL
jgi:hypothetical protein